MSSPHPPYRHLNLTLAAPQQPGTITKPLRQSSHLESFVWPKIESSGESSVDFLLLTTQHTVHPRLWLGAFYGWTKHFSISSITISLIDFSSKAHWALNLARNVSGNCTRIATIFAIVLFPNYSLRQTATGQRLDHCNNAR